MSLRDPGLLFIPNWNRCSSGSECQPQRKAKPSGKASGRPQSFPAGGSGSMEGGSPGCQGLLLSSPLGSFPSITHLLTGRIPLHCSLADATLVLHREAGHTTVTSQPSLGASSRNGNSGVSHDAQKGSTLIIQLSSGASSCHHWSRAAKAPAARWQSWGMSWENARV